jgi:hypothetical protein
MHRLRVSNGGMLIARRYSSVFLLGFLLGAPLLEAQGNLGPVTVGAGMQTDFVSTNTASTPTSASTTKNEFQLLSARIYISGPITKDISFMFNTEYDGASNKVGILDAVGEISLAPQFNIWAGRFLPPSDRANLYGPYYANEFKVYTDGIQDGYPFAATGRDNGAMWWGDFGKVVKASFGLFDGATTTGNSKILGAARVQLDFWDKEDGYYLNGTYYGDKNLLSLGGATQFQDGHTATTVDFLLEKKVLNGGAFSIESEYSNYNRLGGYNGAFAKSQGAYALASFLFPKVVTMGKIDGKFEILGKYAKADFTHGGALPSYDQKTTEINVDYVIKQFKARVMTFYKDTRFNREVRNFWQAGIGLQIQM